ncbi:MAG: hypothetical protein ACRDOE_09545, partial [Streptosporangiaceae bacterium]
PSPQLPDELRRIDESNTQWLAELTERLGWPGRARLVRLVRGPHARPPLTLNQHAPPMRAHMSPWSRG